MKPITIPIVLAIIAAAAHASVIQFIDAPTHINDGSFFALPYEITIDGKPQLVACYDIYDDVNFGDTWQAQLLSLSQASITGFFSSNPASLAKYERVAWLDAQPYSTTAEQIGLQYAIWDVFGSYRSSPESLLYEASADRAAALNFAGVDFSQVRFIEQTGGVAGQSGTKQAFVFWQSLPSDSVTVNNPTPEPQSLLLTLSGGLLIAGMVAMGRARRKPAPARSSPPRS
ncbi:MAG: hypothetical protein ABJC09_04490 [Terriglobia bacterium]